MSREQQAMERVALRYYQDNLTQEEIATRLSMSRSRVVRLLQEARRRGVVQIRVVTTAASNIDLERTLEARFDLRQVAQLARQLGTRYRMLRVARHLISASLVSAVLADARIRSTLELARRADFADRAQFFDADGRPCPSELDERPANVLVTDTDTATALLGSGQLDVPRRTPTVPAHATRARTRTPNRPLVRASREGRSQAHRDVDEGGR